jgi:hypothetical protein
VTEYRLYRVGAGERLQLAAVFHAADDAQAARLAGGRLDVGQAAELWEGGRLVGRFSKIGSFSSAR